VVESLTHLQIAALIIAIVCGVIDFRTTKIPNMITFPATLLGWVLNLIAGGWPALGSAVAGAVLGAVITCIPKWNKRDSIAYGDAKLIMAMGAFLGWIGVLLVFFYFSLVWGLIAMYRFVSVLPLKNMLGGLLAKQAGGSWFTAETAAKVQKSMQTPIPLAPAIATGVLLAELFGPATLQFMGFTQ
jgi:prepilin signal peptidase PulO-like enzyme (type II secretory pathway)